MFECYECGHQIDEQDVEYECPFCGEDDYGEGFVRCENCETLYTISGDLWECPYCENEGKTDTPNTDYCECPSCGAVIIGDVCEECDWPDVNQGWLGEEYG